MNEPSFGFMLAGYGIISGDTAGDTLAGDANIIINCLLEIEKNYTGSIEGVNGEAQEKEEDCSQEMLRRYSLSTRPAFLKRL